MLPLIGFSPISREFLSSDDHVMTKIKSQTEKKKITKRVVDAAQPHGSDDVIIWDTEVSGFRLRVRPSGRKVYEVRYRSDESSVQRQIAIGRHGSPWTPDSARDRARQILQGVDQGQDPLAARAEARSALTVAELCEAYLSKGPAHKPTKRESSWDVDRYCLNNHLIPLLGSVRAKLLRPAQLAEWQAQVAAGATAKRKPSEKLRGVIRIKGGRGAAARAMRSTAAMLAWAKTQDLIESNPAERVAKIPDGRRERYLSDEEGAAIWRAIDALNRARSITLAQASFFRLLMLTGARRGEILGLRWAEVDLQRGLLLLPPARHKTGGVSRPKTLHLSPAALDVLSELKSLQTGLQHVFPARSTRTTADRDSRVDTSDAPMTPPKAAWDRVLAKAGVQDASFHTLRHTFASQVISTGESLYTLSKMLGHARATTTERYAHLQSSAGSAAAQYIAERYQRLGLDPPAST
jgi:integrase